MLLVLTHLRRIVRSGNLISGDRKTVTFSTESKGIKNVLDKIRNKNNN